MAVTSAMRDNDSMPINVGWHYKMFPRNGDDWVEIIAIEGGMVYVEGIENTIAAWSVPTWKFDDLMCDYREA